MSPAICFNLDQSKISSSGNGLKTAVYLGNIQQRQMVGKNKMVVTGIILLSKLFFTGSENSFSCHLFSYEFICLIPYHMIPTFNNLEKETFFGNQHFLLFPQCFLLFPKQISIHKPH